MVAILKFIQMNFGKKAKEYLQLRKYFFIFIIISIILYMPLAWKMFEKNKSVVNFLLIFAFIPAIVSLLFLFIENKFFKNNK
jgi:hypothetical protein